MDREEKTGNQGASVANARVKGKKDPLKLRLEQICL